MLFYWLAQFFRRIAWLFRTPKPRDVARITKDSPCPVCGANMGVIRTVERFDMVNKRAIVLCQKTCDECGARTFELPIVKVTPDVVWPCIPRTELEKAEDADIQHQRRMYEANQQN